MHIVSLTTDFGFEDYYVAELKAHIYRQTLDVNIVDVSHVIGSHDIVQAAHFVDNVFRNFPESSIHCVAVHNYYDKDSFFITFEREGHFFIGPNNGIFSLIFEDLDSSEVFIIDQGQSKLDNISNTIGWAVGYISKNKNIKNIGSLVENFNQKMGIKPVITGTQIRATIIHIDHFENVVINLKKDQFETLRAGRSFQLYYKQTDPITSISDNYGSVPISDVICKFNSSGYMQIGINMGKASSRLNLNKNETIQINFL